MENVEVVELGRMVEGERMKSGRYIIIVILNFKYVK